MFRACGTGSRHRIFHTTYSLFLVFLLSCSYKSLLKVDSWCAITPKVIGHFRSVRPRNLLQSWLNLLCCNTIQLCSNSSVFSNFCPSSSRLQIIVCGVYMGKHSHGHTRLSLFFKGWLLLSLPPKNLLLINSTTAFQVCHYQGMNCSASVLAEKCAICTLPNISKVFCPEYL